ncbi:WD40 repeat-like protein [Artomyces pyxidatus]|uniref:WD40 repeat-like protein n=1 Tax=Artomyces pyxidatus TaxID=48021 RepID=A0ACB8T8T3_9AGAM|nr:WD40 repeat-like protein [Artomyces pyxidatus]
MSNQLITQNVKAENFLRAEAELILDKARKEKAEKNKYLGDPITLSGVPIDIKVRGRYAWIAENAHQARKIDLETGKTTQIYRGHTGPVTCLAFCDRILGSGDQKILLTGSWDMTIKAWDTDTKALISSTPAHSDFVKTLLVIPSLNLLISGSSDKSVRFWDLSSVSTSSQLPSLGSISSHTRPVESLDAYIPQKSGPEKVEFVLFTANTMGVIKVWNMAKEGEGDRTIWRSTLRDELVHHRTRVNELIYGDGHLWTASTDDTIQVHPYPPPPSKEKPYPQITHTTAFKAVLPLYLQPQLDAEAFPYILAGTGDVIHVYDISTLDEPEFVREVEGHWHDVTHLRLWSREAKDGKSRELWVISASLDGTIRRWKLSELLLPAGSELEASPATAPVEAPNKPILSALTEEEERELAELMEDEDV